MYILLNLQGLYRQVIITTCLTVFALLSLFYFKKDEVVEYISNNNNYTIFVVVFMIVVLFQFVYYFLFGYSKIIRIIVASIVILCFMFLLITDTQKILQITPKNCKKALEMCKDDITNVGCEIDNYPSYPQKSFDIFHDIIILARNIAQIYLATNND
jgi:FtsH-binding integral membrane protein